MTAPVDHEQKQKPAQGASSKACVFELGAVCATPAAVAVLEEAGVFFMQLVARHVRGDFGNVCPDDAEANREAIENGSRILSSYPVGNQDVWVITEADRSVTTILLPSDY